MLDDMMDSPALDVIEEKPKRYDVVLRRDDDAPAFAVVLWFPDFPSVTADEITAKADIRTEPLGSDASPPPLLSWPINVGDHRIHTDLADNEVRIFFGMTATETRTLPAGKLVYDLQIVDPLGRRRTAIEGQIDVQGDVTR